MTLNLPPYEAKIQQSNGKDQIFDDLRRCYVALTPEEWVRQHFVHMLIEHKGYPATLTANEVAISLNGMNRRCDTVVYDAQGKPQVLIEYKAPHVPISQEVFDQIVRYNSQFCVSYIIVSNGLNHYCCHIDYTNRTHTFLPEVPAYDVLK